VTIFSSGGRSVGVKSPHPIDFAHTTLPLNFCIGSIDTSIQIGNNYL
jgi:hypothetical protein